MIPDKVTLLMEETGCEKAEAELALEMCGFEVEEAVRAIPRLLKNIAVLKGKFVWGKHSQFGLILVIVNTKTRAVLRTRAVLSYNPAVYAVSLEKEWFEFEKYLFGCRLWEGSLPAESLEIEQTIANHMRSPAAGDLIDSLTGEGTERAEKDLTELLRSLARTSPVDLKLKRTILDLGQFQSLKNDPDAGRRAPRDPGRAEDLLILKTILEEDPEGTAASELRAGDLVSAKIADSRDIAQYLAKLFGGGDAQGPVPITAPVEAVEMNASGGSLIRVRFSVGVCGDAPVEPDSRYKIIHNPQRHHPSWWRRFLPR